MRKCCFVLSLTAGTEAATTTADRIQGNVEACRKLFRWYFYLWLSFWASNWQTCAHLYPHSPLLDTSFLVNEKGPRCRRRRRWWPGYNYIVFHIIAKYPKWVRVFTSRSTIRRTTVFDLIASLFVDVVVVVVVVVKRSTTVLTDGRRCRN